MVINHFESKVEEIQSKYVHLLAILFSLLSEIDVKFQRKDIQLKSKHTFSSHFIMKLILPLPSDINSRSASVNFPTIPILIKKSSGIASSTSLLFIIFSIRRLQSLASL